MHNRIESNPIDHVIYKRARKLINLASYFGQLKNAAKF